ncbi:YwdI family protein [Virgibacillus necropolis]|uniref:YwdI family protein n=1 Tax=Virgibacillus necropolis TaxID=163877 RepID=UPI00384AAE83
MAIPNETILKKMMHELQQAQSYQNNQRQMVKHIENVRLLSDLLIDGEQDELVKKSTNSMDISSEEMKAMLGSSSSVKTNSKQESEVEKDDANGKSILDF